MIRKIITIDQSKCNGCGLCAAACHEGAIEMIAGKAKLVRENYCDGLGDCLPACPVNAISFEEREAQAYDEAAVKLSKPEKEKTASCNCPRSAPCSVSCNCPPETAISVNSQLRQWPVQIKLAPIHAPYYQGSHLLIAADCTAYAYGNFHNDFIRNRITLIGCPKLDQTDYSKKISLILENNHIQSVTVVRMEVPCCGGIEYAAQQAIARSGKSLPLQVITVSTEGHLLRE